jgi:glycosyltransferase involved in cell wall biosynthesis
VRPVVTVVLPVYNCPQYVGEAIESILAQSYGDFEFIVIDDGSTDETPGILAAYRDSRIRLYRHGNRGLAATLNRGIELARGSYIARQDQDDVSMPTRLAIQVAHMKANQQCALVGTWARIRRELADTHRYHKHAADSDSLKFELLLNNPFVHSSVMMRSSALMRVGGYCEDRTRQPPEDYELWSRMARHYEVANIPEVLHIYRETAGSMSRNGSSPFRNHLVNISAENIAWATGVPSSHPHVINLASLVHDAPFRLQGRPDLSEMTKIFKRASEAVVRPERAREFARRAEDIVRQFRFSHPHLFRTNVLMRLAHRTMARLGKHG